ncbi:hypothetical protein DV736_g3997, partial [Chaetothyriales sp. CBS 134916]
MGDPLSVAASVAGLLSLGLQSTEYLYNFYTACRDQHQELARVADKLGGLLESLQIIDEIVRTHTWRHNDQSIIQNIETSIARSEDIIHDLQDETAKFKKEPTDGWRKKAVVVGRRAAYPFKRSTLEDLGDDVNNFRDNLSLALQTLQLKEHQNTQNDIEAVNAIINNIRAQHVSDSLRQWLRAPDATVDFNDASAKRHESTGQWLVQGPAYTAWLQQDNSFLWLYGFAGCGKSVLCSTAIQHTILHRQSSPHSVVAFFFFTFNDHLKQDASAALRALLLQLCGQISGLESDLTRLKESYNHGTPPVKVLLEHLRQAVTQCRHVYILLDALDESPPDSSRDKVLSVIETLRQWQLPSLHLLVTSRDLPDIRDHLQLPTLYQGAEHVMLNNDSVYQDISRFVSFKVDHDPQLQRWGQHREKIKSYLTQHAGGIEKHLEKCLRSLPQSLDETYERMLCGIESQEEAQRILSLLCYASRPLSVDEVTEALAVDIDDLECYDPSSRFTGGADDLLRIFERWIQLHNPDNPWYTKVNYQKTAKDRASATYYASLLGLDSVLTYILSISAVDVNTQGGYYGNALQAALANGHEKAVQILLDKGADINAQGGHYGNALQAALANGHEKAVQILLDKGADINAQGGHYGNALQAASANGHEKAVQILLDKGADVNAQGGFYGNALQAASANGHEKVVQILLDKGADVNAQGGRYGNALQAASANGHEKAVQILLDKGADVNAQGGFYGNALQAASANSHEKAVQILLDKGADVNAQGGYYGNALQAASFNSHEKAVQILLDKGADINAQGGCYGNALQAASFNSHEKAVQILLDKGADINAQGGCYGNALQAASFNSHEKAVQILLDKGADVNAQGGRYGNALQAASANGHEKAVQILLDKGADVNAQGGLYGNALQAALANGHEKVVQILLDKGADVNAQGGLYGNALQAASFNSHEKGAEGLVFKTHFLDPGTPAALKVRPSKAYRHPTLDARLTKQRVLAEARVLVKLSGVGEVSVPGVLSVEWDAGRKAKGRDRQQGADGRRGGGAWLLMEWVEGQSVKEVVRAWDSWHRHGRCSAEEKAQGQEALKALMRRIGRTIGFLHSKGGVVHGDLTTSNIMLRRSSASSAAADGEQQMPSLEGDIVLIDFGLATQAIQDEDRAVDLYVLERAFGSTHPMQEHWFDTEVLQSPHGYSGSFKGAGTVLKRLDDVRLRGRKRSMVG